MKAGVQDKAAFERSLASILGGGVGRVVGGHGGVLDRFDSLIGSAPIVYVYLKVIL